MKNQYEKGRRKYVVACKKCGDLAACSTQKSRTCYRCKDGDEYIQGWRTFRKKYLKENSECEICGKTSQLHIHHVDRNKRNNDMDNLKVRCSQCHISLHRSEGKELIKVDYQLHGVRLIYG